MKIKDDINHKFEELIGLAKQLFEDGKYEDAITKCLSAAELAERGDLFKEVMQVRNLLASVYRSNDDVSGMACEYFNVICIGRVHGLRYSDEYTEALFHYAVFLTRLQPVPPNLFTTMEELIEVRGMMVDDENDSDLQSYREMLETLRRVYKRKKRLRKVRGYTYTKILGKV